MRWRRKKKRNHIKLAIMQITENGLHIDAIPNEWIEIIRLTYTKQFEIDK